MSILHTPTRKNLIKIHKKCIYQVASARFTSKPHFTDGDFSFASVKCVAVTQNL